MVFIGGGFGSLLRYFIGTTVQFTGLKLPIATLVSNVIACLIFAISLNAILGKPNENTLKLLILTGFCGGLSTFSTFGYENYLLLKQQQYFWIIANIAVTLFLCISGFFIIKK